MLDLLKKEIIGHGDRFRVIPIERLEDLRKDIEEFRKTDELNGFQKYITSSLYRFEQPEAEFRACSVIIIASPVPAYAKVTAVWHGRKVPLVSLARSYTGKRDAAFETGQYLTRLLEPSGYHIIKAPDLPLKRLAARSGLASYGRNNICYVEGMGSFLTLVAYFTDIPCEEDAWQEIRTMERCSGCSACMGSCPTGAILKGRFLIDNERCLSFFNEAPGNFPDWMPEAVHHCLYDCLVCQRVCPQNKEYINNVTGPVEFDEEETSLLLSGKPLEELPSALVEKVVFLGMDQWFAAIPRNMRILVERAESAGYCV